MAVGLDEDQGLPRLLLAQCQDVAGLAVDAIQQGLIPAVRLANVTQGQARTTRGNGLRYTEHRNLHIFLLLALENTSQAAVCRVGTLELTPTAIGSGWIPVLAINYVLSLISSGLDRGLGFGCGI